MKKSFRFVLAIVTVVLMGGSLGVTFNNSVAEAKTIPTKPIVQKKIVPVVKVAKKVTTAKPLVRVSAPIYLTAADVKKIIASQIEDLINQGKLATTTNNTGLSFDKLNNLNSNYNDDTPGFQPYYIPAAALSGVGTFLSATNIGADSLSSNSASMTTLSVSDASTLNNLTVNALASFGGGLSLASPTEGSIINTDSGAFLSVGGDWTNASSKDYKENFTTLDSDDVLAKINALPIMRWNYKKEASSTTHIGPLAEDFHSAFQVGGSEKNISTIDPAGVALLGIQALNKKIAELERKLEGQTCTAPLAANIQNNTSDSSSIVSQELSLPAPQTVVSTTVEVVEQSSSTPIVEVVSSETPTVSPVPLAEPATTTIN